MHSRRNTTSDRSNTPYMPPPHSSLADLERVLEFVAHRAEMHVNVKLHKKVPSLVDKKTKISILQGFCEAGRYMTLFDIGTGGGCTNLDARRAWERRMFGTVYDGSDTQRPRYGNLNLMAHLKGDKTAGHYGKSYLILKKHVRKRCTMTSCDSSNANAVLGTLRHSAHVLLHTVELCGSARRRKKFLQQLDQLLKWDGTKKFHAVKVELAR